MADILPVFGPNCRNKYILTSSFGSINIEFIGRVVKGPGAFFNVYFDG